MPQFDVFKNVAEPGYLLDCQSDALSGLNTRLVVPLLPTDYAPKPSHRLNPLLSMDQEQFVMMTHFVSAVPTRDLGQAVGSLAQEYTVIMNAFDMLLTGY